MYRNLYDHSFFANGPGLIPARAAGQPINGITQ
jgi:hypothetical protein